MDELEFAQQFAPSGPPTVNDVFRRALMSDRADLEQAAAEKAAADAREAARENMALANRQMGDPLGNVTRAQMAVAEARDKVRALEDQLEAARGVLHRAGEQYVDWQESAELVTATASRSAPHNMLDGARKVLTDAQVREMAAVRSQAPGRRPFGHGGHAVRSEFTCAGCKAEGIDADTSFLLHSDPDRDPGLDAEMDFYPEPGGPVQRRGYAEGREIVRAVGYNDDGVYGNHQPVAGL
jgi:hypothetical protein